MSLFDLRLSHVTTTLSSKVGARLEPDGLGLCVEFVLLSMELSELRVGRRRLRDRQTVGGVVMT